MSLYEPIHKISVQLGLTSRTLRHWEEMKLFKSVRDLQSGWRVYDKEAVDRIRLTLLLRELNIPIKAVKAILDSAEPRLAAKIIATQVDELAQEEIIIAQRKEILDKCVTLLNSMQLLPDTSQCIISMEKALAHQLSSLQNHENFQEEILMSHNTNTLETIRIINLPPMQVAVCNIISDSPEEEALNKVLGWSESEGLMGTARIFGTNTTTYTPGCAEYGWAACITIPEHITLPDYLEGKHLPGGLYAMVASTNEIYDSWQTLIKNLEQSKEYKSDHSDRPCLEEHIQKGDSAGFYLNLLEPVCKR
jgi:DNA-binding transcriptional MerR regulator/DNA gyrase inhibitor GyrI